MILVDVWATVDPGSGEGFSECSTEECKEFGKVSFEISLLERDGLSFTIL